KTRERLDAGQHAPARPEDDVPVADRRIGHEGEVGRHLQVGQLARSPEDQGPEADLQQMKASDPDEEAEEEANPAMHAPGLDDVADPGEPVDQQKHPEALDDYAGCEQREGEQRQMHGPLPTESSATLPTGGAAGSRRMRSVAAVDDA